MTPLVNQGTHVFGPYAIEEHAFAGAGVGEAKGFGVQYLSRAQGEAVVDILAVALGPQAFENLGATVFLIGEKRMPDGAHVYTNLVGSSGLQTTFDQRDIREPLQYTPMGDCLFGIGILFGVEDGIACSIAWVSIQCTNNRARLFVERTPDECIIGSFGGVLEELMCQMGFRFGRFCYEEQTTGVFVDTVNESDVGIVDIERTGLKIKLQRIEQGVLVVAMSRVDNHSGRFVDQHQVVVFIDDVEWNILGVDGIVVWLVVEQHLDDVTGANFLVGSHGLAIDPHVAGIRSRLDAVAAGSGHVLAQVFIHANGGLAFIDLGAPTFEEFFVVLHIVFTCACALEEILVALLRVGGSCFLEVGGKTDIDLRTL